ncbi:hypothetical protein [Blautia wexlerae]|uniref:hypothetical protein n=4 Tax=Blautia wexlerae TaxID=418240 RepID=UPI0034A11C3A
MTKIKNTKKGMAKKTLSMSLVVAMLATSNVPVWAAEFSDGTDVAVTSEAPAADVETFSDDTDSTPVVDNTEVETETVAATTTEKLNVTTAEVSAPTVLAGDLKNNEGTDVRTFTYKWLVDGVEPADASGVAVTGSSGTSTTGKTGINAFTPGTNHAGKSLTLEITGTGTFEGFTYTTPAVTIKSRDITKVVKSINSTATLKYDGTAKTLSANDVALTYQDGVTEAEKALVTASDFTFAYNGDTVNATESGKNIKVIATINKAGYTGSITFTITIGKKTSANSSENDLNDKDANDLTVNMKKTQYKYTGKAIDFTTNVEDNFTLKSNISGNTLSSKAVTTVTPVTSGVTLKEVGAKDKVKVGIDVTKDKELNKNYESTAFTGKYYYAPEEVSVIARDLSTCTIDNISIGSLKAQDVTKDYIKNLITISEGKEILTKQSGSDFDNQFDIEVNIDDIKKGGEGAYDVVVKPTDVTKNVVGKKTIKLYVTQNDIATATLKSTGAQLKNNDTTVTKNITLDDTTVFADEYYQGGTAITKTADQLGTIIIGSEGTVLKEGTDYKLVYKNNTNVSTGTTKAEIWIQGTGSTFSGSKCIGKFDIVTPTIDSDTITVPKTVTYDGSKTAADEYLKKADVKVQAAAYTWSKNAAGTFVKTKKLIDVPEKLYDTVFTPDSGVTDGTTLTTRVKLASNVDTESDDYKNYGVAGLDVNLVNKTTVSTASIANTTITVVGAPFVYTGKEITPDLVVKDGDRTLVKDVDYEVVTTVNAKNAGTAKITIKGKGDYSKTTTKTVEFTINKADLSKVTITPKKSAANNFKYTGKKLTPDITTNYDIKLGDVTLNASDENLKIVYPASSSANVNAGKEAGSGTLTVKDSAKNPNFEGTNAFKFDIAQADLTTGGTFTLWKDGKVVGFDKTAITATDVANFNPIFTNDGTEHTFDKVTYTPADSKYKEGTDYEVKYYNNVRGEVAAIYVNALGNYKNKEDAAHTFADKKTTFTDARFFKIGSISIKKSDVKVADTEYAGGIAVKPTVTVTVNGKTLVDDSDYKIETVGDASNVTAKDKILKAKLYAKDGYVLDTTTWGNDIKSDTNGKQYVELKWKVVAKDLKNTTVTVDKDGNVTVMNGSVVVPSSEYDVKVSEDGKKVTVTAKADSKNYTGSKEVDVNAVKVGAPVISNVKVSGNKATVILSGEAEDAAGYDYVISTSKDPSDTAARVDVIKNQVQTTSTFKYVQQGTYYAYCHAWKRDENGKKVFGDWSNVYAFSVTAITPDTPEILSVKTSGSTITVTYKESANSTGYDVVLGTGSKKEHGETRPYNYGTYKKLNVKTGVCKATFKNVAKGTYYVGVHSWNRSASENNNKVFSKWSNLKKTTVK